ncbi:MAG: hypothetical protein B7Z60_02975 [Ferrovum sp. 37-45-19]|uniref:DUF2782 domain-containing protein n=1 Tax=Ferrovum sp. JA12 TaxID=1356299 RepID=UPI00070374A7|nr:DUF2782 domain-containing protein [Ferrovum sp. JA12]KRH79173.1 hypothetical protein FERRO_02360 [Ferrovum sp. JA12]OYV80464.1 MAG: hypothetical protein B7Z65_01045 [Ferrovum sp. 21-44-67]OYV94779.1 MAG: hypothetical protein B7Z60_02975 [Ferrovum sp. 37-45-19]HQT81101.1 DUF2782 domain-containing protein [Ferrovaceae bacterium]
MTFRSRILTSFMSLMVIGVTLPCSYAEDNNFKSAPPPPEYGVNKDNNEPADEPQVTIVQKSDATFEETRYHGKLYKIKVTPKVGKPYYLIDEEGKGVWHRYDGPVDQTIVPQWVILKF